MDRMIKISLLLTAVDRMSAAVNSAVNRSIAGLKTLKSKSDEISKSAFSFGRDAGAMGVGMAAPIVGMMKAAADMERMNVALKTAFQGNEAAANNAFSTINKFAATTPYELEEVMRGFVKLKNMGLDPSINALTSYGNTASSMGKSLNDMVEAVADAATGEFERLKEFGIKAKTQGDKVTFTFQGVNTTVKKNAADIEKYLLNIGNTKFAGGIEAQGKTVYGQLSTLKDNAKMVAASIGTMLIPTLNSLIQRIVPIIERVQAWVDKNPRLTKTIVIVTAALSALMLAMSAFGFVVGGVAQAISVFSSVGLVFAGTLKALSFGLFWLRYQAVFSVLPAIKTMWAVISAFGTSLLANPITWFVAAVVGLALAAYLIYKHWDKIKAWFVALWARIKQIFNSFVDFVKKWIWYIHPAGIIYKHWGQISAFFVYLWDRVKAIFNGVVNWLFGLGTTFFNAGKNIITSIWEGMKAIASKPVEVVRDIAKKIREYLPFSPAKVGPLRDIHRIKLIETIAEGIKPNALVNAMHRTAQMAFNVIPRVGAQQAITPAFAGGGSRVNLHYSPSISMGGGMSGGGMDIQQLLNQHARHITQLVTEQLARRERTKY